MARSFKALAAVTSFTLLVSACGLGEKSENGRVDVAPPPAPVEYTLNGTDLMMSDVERDLTAFTIDFALKSAQATLDAPYSDTNPPMPFVMGDVSFFQEPGRYSVYLSANETSLGGGSPLDWTRVTIASDGYKTELYINGFLTSEASHSTPIAMNTQLLIGKGFKERYWAGKMKYFDVYGSYISAQATQDIDDRLTGTRIYELK